MTDAYSQAERDYRADLAQRSGARAPASLGEVWTSEWRRSGLDTLFGQARYLSESHDELQRAIEGASGTSIGEFARANGVRFDGTVEGRIAALNRLADLLPEEARQEIEPLRDVRARASDKAQKVEKEAAETDAATYGLSGVATGFLAGMARQLADPAVLAANIATAPIGGPIAGRFIPVVARQAAAGAIGQALVEPAIERGRAELGLDSGFTRAAGNVLEAGLGSGALTALFKGGAAAIRAARGVSRAEKPGGGADVSGAPENRTVESPNGSALEPADLEAAAALAERNALLDRLTRGGASAQDLEAVTAALENARPVDRASEVLARGRRAANPNLFLPTDADGRELLIRPGGERLAVQSRVVELSDLVASHDLEGRPNVNYPAELQPRDRAAPASRAFIAERAAALEPELLGASPTAATGAPVIGPDGLVESGNGRVMMIARAYDRHPERAAAYRAFLEREGYDVADMKFPVLVRVREGELPLSQRAALAREANVAPTAGFSIRERARADAQALDAAVLAHWRGGDIASAENAGFVRAFVERVVAAEDRPSFIGADDRLSADGAKRIEAALVQRAWAADDVVAALYESADPNSRAITGAFADTAPLMARLKAAVADGRIGADVDPAPALLDAFRLVVRARATGAKVADLVEQLDLEKGAVPDNVKAAARLYFRNDELTLAAGRDAVAARITQAIERALDQGNAVGDLFGAAFDTAGTLRAAKLAGQGLDEQPLFSGQATGVVARTALELPEFLSARQKLTAAQPFATIDEALAIAPAHQARLIAALQEAAGDASAVKDPGVKHNRARMEQKVAEKYRGNVKGLTDLVRAGVAVAAPDHADAIAQSLGKSLRVIDEGWHVNDAGYLDRKLEVIFPDGMMAEVQLWPPEILAAKTEGEAMYVRRREAAPAARAAMLELEQAYWAAVRSRLDAAWSEIGGSPNASKSDANALRASASDSSRPSQVTSASATGRQPLAPTENARAPDTTATVSPQENQRVGDAGIGASKDNVSAPGSEGNMLARLVADQADEQARRGGPGVVEAHALRQEAERVLGDLGDLELAVVAPDGSLRKLSARAALQEAAEDAQAAAELSACIGEAAKEAA